MNTVTIYNHTALEYLHVDLYDDGLLQVSSGDDVIAEVSISVESGRRRLHQARAALRDMLGKVGDVLPIDEVLEKS